MPFIRNLFRWIMPFGIVERIQKKNQAEREKSLGNIKMGNSVLLPGFALSIFKEQPGRKYVTIGDDTLLECQMSFESGEGEIVIGDRVYIGQSKLISRTRIEFENDIFVAWGCYFYDHDSHSLDYRERQNDLKQQVKDYREGKYFIENKNWDCVNTKPIKVCSNAWIGMHAIILKGVTIGEGAVVAAGSVVTRDVEPWTVVAGNPAKPVKKLQ